jgi:hypothetical protein
LFFFTQKCHLNKAGNLKKILEQLQISIIPCVNHEEVEIVSSADLEASQIYIFTLQNIVNRQKYKSQKKNEIINISIFKCELALYVAD